MLRVSPIGGCETSHQLNSGYDLKALALVQVLQAAAKGQDFWPCIAAIANKAFASLGQTFAGRLPTLLAMSALLLIQSAGQAMPSSTREQAKGHNAHNEIDLGRVAARVIETRP